MPKMELPSAKLWFFGYFGINAVHYLMPVGFIEYKGKQILYVELREENTEEKALRALEEKVVIFEETKEKLLIII